jgi:hypothetical protein
MNIKSMTYSFTNKPVEMTDTFLPRPMEATWKNAKLYRVHLMDSRWPVCGTRLVWAIVGYKWVRICTPIQNTKFRMRRADWDNLSTRDFIRE